MAKTIPGSCTGCGEVLEYRIDHSGHAPEILPPTWAVAYADGHLCPGCERDARVFLGKRAADRRAAAEEAAREAGRGK